MRKRMPLAAAKALVPLPGTNETSTSVAPANGAALGHLAAIPLKAALEAQVQLYKSMARLSPLNIALQGAMQGQALLLSMMQGLLPGAANARAKNDTGSR